MRFRLREPAAVVRLQPRDRRLGLRVVRRRRVAVRGRSVGLGVEPGGVAHLAGDAVDVAGPGDQQLVSRLGMNEVVAEDRLAGAGRVARR